MIMKKICIYFISFLILTACEYDNYDSPNIVFSGRLLYNDQPFIYDGNDDRGLFLFFQEGFGKIDWGTGMHTKTDGSYQQLLYKGDYKLTLNNVRYPFEIAEFPSRAIGYDSIQYDLKRNIEQNFHVTPYYEISDLDAVLDGIDIKASFKVKKVSGTSRPAPRIVKARIYLGINNFVNSKSTVVGETDVNLNDDGEITVSIDAIKYRNGYKENYREYAYYRVAIELENIPDYYLFSDTKLISEIPEEFNDVTDDYLKNYRQPFKVLSYFPVPSDMRRGILADWIASNSDIEYTMYDGWGDRLFMCAENWGSPNRLEGSVYQSFTLPAGKYVFIARRGWNWWDIENTGGKERAFFAIAKGKGIEWKSSNIIAQSDCGDPSNRVSIPLTITLENDTEISMGYVVNFPAGETNALSFTSFTIYSI